MEKPNIPEDNQTLHKRYKQKERDCGHVSGIAEKH